MKSRLILLVTTLWFACGPAAQADLSQLPEKASTDRSEYRHLVLDNGLRVLLLSDPDLNKSSASLVVAAGSYMDPEDRAGLAHFLEHMLLRGTEKYPDEGEYKNYVNSNGGYSNAYTAGDHTNYHFEINHQAFEGALDRFSQFFIAPLFTADLTEREMNAVDSEFEKNLESDGWRGQEMFRTMVREDHPENHFTIGNLRTLSGIERSEFIAFYDRFYSANLMALALTSDAGLDKMEDWVRQYFAAIENRQRPEVDFSADLVDPGRPPGVVLFEPVTDRRALSLSFPTRGTRALYRSKPDALVGFLLGYEGEGSLLSHLKQEGLATGLSGGGYAASKDYSLFGIEVQLTPSGAENWQQVMQSIFAYVDLLRGSDFPAYLFDERATVARLEELYSDKGEGAGRAIGLANNARQYPLEDAARANYIWEEPSPELYFEVLDYLRPDNMIALLEMKGVPTDQKEEHFGIEYSYQAFTPELMAALEQPASVAELTLPAPNRFIPTKVDLLAQQPVKVIDEPGLTLYYAQDTTFERPRVSYQVRIRQPEKMGKLNAVVMRDFYTSVINEMLNEQAYAAAVAGLGATVADSPEGVRISVSGYSQSANSFLDYVLSQMTTINLPAERFEALKERKLRAWKNAEFADAYRQTLELERKYLIENYFTPAEKLSAAQEIDLDDVRRFTKELFKKGNVEMVAYGNVSQEDATRAARQVVAALELAPVPMSDVYDTRTLILDGEQPVLAANQLIVNNSAYIQGFLLGDATPRNRAAALMLRNFIDEPYFSEMRTRQQLGYIAASFMSEQEKNLFVRFLIQSADYSADELNRRSKEFLANLPDLFDQLPDDQVEVLRSAVRAELEEKDKSIAERAARYFMLAFEKDADWGQRAETIAELERLTRNNLRAMLQLLADEGSRQFTTLSMAEQHAEALDTISPSFTDIESWKRKQTYE
ncbi:MAG: insulinase family protein [Woeseiaceae bacterium]